MPLTCIAIKNKSKGLDWAISRVTHRARERVSETLIRWQESISVLDMLVFYFTTACVHQMYQCSHSPLVICCCRFLLLFSLFFHSSVSCRRLFSSLCFIFSCVCCCHSLVLWRNTAHTAHTVFRSDPFGLRACGRSVAKHKHRLHCTDICYVSMSDFLRTILPQFRVKKSLSLSLRWLFELRTATKWSCTS